MSRWLGAALKAGGTVAVCRASGSWVYTPQPNGVVTCKPMVTEKADMWLDECAPVPEASWVYKLWKEEQRK